MTNLYCGTEGQMPGGHAPHIMWQPLLSHGSWIQKGTGLSPTLHTWGGGCMEENSPGSLALGWRT